MQLVPYISYLFLIAFYRTILVDIFSIGPIQIYLTVLLVILVALNKDVLTSLWFGFAAGLIYDAGDPSLLGIQMILLSLIGVATSLLKQKFNLESMKSLTFLLLSGMLFYSIPYTLIYMTSGIAEFMKAMIQISIPSVIYSTFVGWIFFMIHSGRISYAKLRSSF